LVGANGIVLVCDGTRPNTASDLQDIWQVVKKRIGEVPVVVALNKADLDDWTISDADYDFFKQQGWQTFETSAKDGNNVEVLFEALVNEIIE